MHAKDFVIDKCGDWHAVENILEFFPNSDRVATLALVVEAIYTVDLAALMVASQQEKVLLELDLVGEEQDDRLKRILSTVNIVSQEKVVCLRRETTIFK